MRWKLPNPFRREDWIRAAAREGFRAAAREAGEPANAPTAPAVGPAAREPISLDERPVVTLP